MFKREEENFLFLSQSDARYGQKQSNEAILKIEEKNTLEKKPSIKS
jgi:hypothetical protein